MIYNKQTIKKNLEKRLNWEQYFNHRFLPKKCDVAKVRRQKNIWRIMIIQGLLKPKIYIIYNGVIEISINLYIHKLEIDSLLNNKISSKYK